MIHAILFYVIFGGMTLLMYKEMGGVRQMTLSELLTYCKTKRKGKEVRVFAGCMTIYKGNPSVIFTHEWVKVQPYFNCKVLKHKVINNTIVVTI